MHIKIKLSWILRYVVLLKLHFLGLCNKLNHKMYREESLRTICIKIEIFILGEFKK